jgi:hypothetical protein
VSLRDLLSHLPQPDTTPLGSPRSLSVDSEKTPLLHPTLHEMSAGSVLNAPKTPVTVTSSFDDAFTAHQRQRGQGNGDAHSGDVVGSRVDLKVLNGELVEKEEVEVVTKRVGNRRGVGPGITWVQLLFVWNEPRVSWLTFMSRYPLDDHSAVFPRFSYPDVNMFIWLFSRKYRRLLRQWEASTRGPPSAASRR